MPRDRERFGRRCDVVVHGGVLVLLAFGPLAFGAVHPWSLATVQLVVATLMVVWAGKLLVCGTSSAATERVRRWRWPLIAFVAVALVQLIPLPPSVVRTISPRTGDIYSGNLWGWPTHEPFGEIMRTAERLSDAVAPDAVDDPLTQRLSDLTARLPRASTWRPLSIYPYRSIEELLLVSTWAAVFFCSSGTSGIVRLTVPSRRHPPPRPWTTGLRLACECGSRW